MSVSTFIKLVFSRIAWKILFGYFMSRLLDRSNPDTTRVSTKIRQARGNLSTKMLFALGDFKAAMAQGLCDLEIRPDDAEAHMLVIASAIELSDFEIAERHLNLLNPYRMPNHLKDQLPFFRYTVSKQCHADGLEFAVLHLDDLYLAMGCQPIQMSRTLHNGDVFESIASADTTLPYCLDGPPPLV